LAKPNSPAPPRTFYLNEHHELAHGENKGRGRPAQYGAIDWAVRGARISSALAASKQKILNSKDPLRDRRYFLVATPIAAVPKVSKDKRKAPTGEFLEKTEYDGDHSRVFRRLGMDLLDVNEQGVATVHTTTERFERLFATAASLAREGAQERARWATIDQFAPVPAGYRVDRDWLQTVSKTKPQDVIVELQPLLSRVEAEDVLTTIARGLSSEENERLLGTGTDFSGRRWLRGSMRRSAIAHIAEQYFSVQSLHPPHITGLSVIRRSSAATVARRAPEVDLNVPDLPTIAIFDTGVPAGHVELGPYRRGTYQHPDAPAAHVGDHGSLVASRVVFGDLDFAAGLQPRPTAACRFLDVMVAKDAHAVEDKAIAPALEAVVATYPDVRVFNMSFGEVLPMGSYSEIERRERLLLVQDLDNFVFARDVVVVIAAGNSPKGTTPANTYPLHIDEPAWQLGAWPSGFNSLTCGATVEALHPDGLVKTPGWPSPFSRVGPGVSAAPMPEYGASGGNLADDWTWRESLGVWGCTADGVWEDRAGTSFAAPLLAREVALAFQQLQRFCPPGGRPFGTTVKAFLAVTATRPPFPPPVAKLADRTIGRGRASAARLLLPVPQSAVFVWQGTIEGPADVVRVQLPIPLTWLARAGMPQLRLVCSWDPPVNEAVRTIWATRKVTTRLRASANGKALRGSQTDHASYPLIDRTYDLTAEKLATLDPAPDSDLWLLELAYEQIAEYSPAITFTPQQRVAFAAELFDASARPISPQDSIQRLPAAATMNRLSVPPSPISSPVILRRN
jgi:hypothetical protein